MTAWIALLRGVNVGGNNKIPMAELKALCEQIGLARVRTYIASGNVIFASDLGEEAIRTAIETAIAKKYGKQIGVLVRSGAEMAEAARLCPWPERPGNRVVALFIDGPVSLDGVRNQQGERLASGPRAIYIDYGDGMADSKLVLPAGKLGTARNMNTVAKLAALAAELG